MVKAASVDAAHWTWGVGVGSAESDESKKSMDFYKWKLHSNNIKWVCSKTRYTPNVAILMVKVIFYIGFDR